MIRRTIKTAITPEKPCRQNSAMYVLSFLLLLSSIVPHFEARIVLTTICLIAMACIGRNMRVRQERYVAHIRQLARACELQRRNGG